MFFFIIFILFFFLADCSIFKLGSLIIDVYFINSLGLFASAFLWWLVFFPVSWRELEFSSKGSRSDSRLKQARLSRTQEHFP